MVLTVRKFEENQDLTANWKINEWRGGKVGGGFVGDVELGVIFVTMKAYAIFMENIAEG